MSKSLILVTGATGKTGSAVVRQLLDLGYPVRATVRRRDERADVLESLGADVVVTDFHDLSSMRDALKDVGGSMHRQLTVYPLLPFLSAAIWKTTSRPDRNLPGYKKHLPYDCMSCQAPS